MGLVEDDMDDHEVMRLLDAREQELGTLVPLPINSPERKAEELAIIRLYRQWYHGFYS